MAKSNRRGWTAEAVDNLYKAGKILGYQVIGPKEIPAAPIVQQEKPKGSKYRNTRIFWEGEWYDSLHELDRYKQLLILQRVGHIRDLMKQVDFKMIVGGELITTYRADFIYVDVATGAIVIEDTKSVATRKKRDYRIKKKLLRALYQLEIVEVMNVEHKKKPKNI